MERAVEDETEQQRVGAPKRPRAVLLTKDGAAKLRTALYAQWEEVDGTRSRPTRSATAELLGVSPKTADRILAGQGVDRNTLIYAFRSVGLEWDDGYCDLLSPHRNNEPMNGPSGHATSEDNLSRLSEPTQETQPGRPTNRRPRRLGTMLALTTAAALVGLAMATRPDLQLAELLTVAVNHNKVEAENFRASSAAAAEFQAGNYAAAHADVMKSMRLAPKLSADTFAVAMRTSADVAAATGDLATARKTYEQALAVRQSMGDQKHQPSLLEALGDLDTRTGELAKAKSELQESLSGYRRYRDVGGVAMCLRDLGTIATKQGHLREAEADFREALDGIEGRNAFDMEHDIGARQALLLVQQGRADKARQMLESCLAYWNHRGHPRWIATTTKQMAILEASVGHTQAAKKLFDDAAVRYEKLGDRFDADECFRANRI